MVTLMKNVYQNNNRTSHGSLLSTVDYKKMANAIKINILQTNY